MRENEAKYNINNSVMKRVIGFILACIFVLNMQAQEEKCWSLKLGTSTPYYFLDEKDGKPIELLAFAPSIGVSKYFNKWNIGAGLDIAFMNVFFYDKSPYLIAVDFPLLVKYNFYHSEKTRLNLVSGIIYNLFGLHNVTLRTPEGRISNIYTDGCPLSAFSLRFGFEYSQELFRILRLNIQPFVNWKFFDKNSVEAYRFRPNKIGDFRLPYENASMPYDFVVGINLGFEIMFKKRQKE